MVTVRHMSKIFISYRRQDTQDVTGRIYDRLLRHLPQDDVFKDVDSIPPGEEFRAFIDDAIGQCAVLLAIIGPQWTAAKNRAGQRRLDDPNDMVRAEIESALDRGTRVIPVLVGGAAMPEPDDLPESIRPLAARHALPVRPDPDFHRDMDRLVERVQAAMQGITLDAELIEPHAVHSSHPAAPPSHYGPQTPTLPPANPYASPQRSAWNEPQTGPPSLFAPAALVIATCLFGLLLNSMALLGATLSAAEHERLAKLPAEERIKDPAYDPAPVDPGIDTFMRGACTVALIANLVGLAGAGGMLARRFYWLTLSGIVFMGVGTLIMCPLLNLPGCLWATYTLLRQPVKASFG